MIGRILALGGIGIAITLAQSTNPGTAKGTQPSATAAKKTPWTPPKTPWGEPDLQGIWPIHHLIAVPMERPKQYGDRLYLTEDEFTKAQANIEARNSRLNGP